ncbi:MAG: family transcriptional regulator, regulator of sulfur utilization [Eubacteriaceae bacterium]|nr:family transcriptional regulator, regulator of sulfur utilization [Eubacteriaceae bacterium]
MDYLNQNIAINLKLIRKEKGMSMDQVAEQTGVSKSMLGQIERGEANPTVGTLGKIISGLRVDLHELIKTPGVGVYEVNRDKLIPTKEVPGSRLSKWRSWSGNCGVYCCPPGSFIA